MPRARRAWGTSAAEIDLPGVVGDGQVELPLAAVDLRPPAIELSRLRDEAGSARVISSSVSLALAEVGLRAGGRRGGEHRGPNSAEGRARPSRRDGRPSAKGSAHRDSGRGRGTRFTFISTAAKRWGHSMRKYGPYRWRKESRRSFEPPLDQKKAKKATGPPRTGGRGNDSIRRLMSPTSPGPAGSAETRPRPGIAPPARLPRLHGNPFLGFPEDGQESRRSSASPRGRSVPGIPRECGATNSAASVNRCTCGFGFRPGRPASKGSACPASGDAAYSRSANCRISGNRRCESCCLDRRRPLGPSAVDREVLSSDDL